jgi:hypothetical protein
MQVKLFELADCSVLLTGKASIIPREVHVLITCSMLLWLWQAFGDSDCLQ